jgi:hypothetical protein
MSTQSRAILKTYFETGKKPTEAQFAELIDSLFSLMDDGGAKVKQLLEALQLNNRLTKAAVRGADFALNRRRKGDVVNQTFQSTYMTSIVKGDFWIYEDSSGGGSDSISEGDWVIAMRDNPDNFNYESENNWWILHFGNTTVTQNTIELQHYRTSLTAEANTVTIPGIHAQIISLTVNKLTYYGKVDDGNFGVYDFVFKFVGSDTVITLNTDYVQFSFQPSMVVDVLYNLITQ